MPCESEAEDEARVEDPQQFRQFLEQMSSQHPELFPAAMRSGFTLQDSYRSVKQGLRLRRITLKATGAVFLVRPSCLLPYLAAKTDEVEKALYLRQWGVPFAALADIFGRDALFYSVPALRLSLALGLHSSPGFLGVYLGRLENRPALSLAFWPQPLTRVGLPTYRRFSRGFVCLSLASFARRDSRSGAE